ncbi:hypothetical protein COT40_00285 [Candidatus Peregrinibacteria bacterium CG08_land_8_20_14_0_20_41_10]|nr:MAG: hypothetical protein AUJ78_00070 [Candidatus Peregrinibacteria bacterium CG1_02_41_10]PIS32387.1 MAG: hypothetical protein COT40_00285 [Candidatus Peregrinibacteria bacterium CG08_land_8_20_14_0_20_41_10]
MLRRTILTVVLNAVMLYAIEKLIIYLGGIFEVKGGILAYVVIGVVIGVLNLVLRPLLRILVFPLALLMSGVVTILINIVILWATVYVLNLLQWEGVQLIIQGIITYLSAAIILGILNSIFNWLFKPKNL